jgi:tetratricopeptide (TPR) repeat protein
MRRWSRFRLRLPPAARRMAWRLSQALVWPFRAAHRFLLGVQSLLIRWWSSRGFRFFLRGVPALLAFCAAGYLLLIGEVRGRTQRAQDYFTAGRTALDSQSYEAARLYYEKGLQIEPNNHEAMFNLAIASQQTGEEFRIAAIMDRLAPVDRAVHPQAHLWKAIQHFQRRGLSRADELAAEVHLRHVLQVRPNDVAANSLLGELYFGQGGFSDPPDMALLERAIEHLERVAGNPRNDPARSLLLARAYLRHGDTSKAERLGRQVLDVYEALSLQNPSDVDALYNWADAAMFLEQYETAVSLLDRSLRLNDAPRTRRGLARVLVAWSDSLDRATAPGRRDCFFKLAAAVRSDPEEQSTYDRMIRLLLHDGALADTAREELLQNITEGRAVGMSHLILGMLDFHTDDPQAARAHLELAYRELPETPIVINNLAWYMAHTPDAELERALGMMNELLGRFPLDQRFRDTRGIILVRMGRTKDAIPDLEAALPSHRDHLETREALAQAYADVGLPRLAEEHRTAAENLRSLRH